jgi:methyl-accepting chemotaxis protein
MRSYAFIEFDLQWQCASRPMPISCQALGYKSEEIVGKHHRMFVDPAEANSPAYQPSSGATWPAARPSRDTFRRITRAGKEIWIQAVYAPVSDEMGRPVKVVKIATDVTAEVTATRMLREAVEQAQKL